jgi:uncharacterized protein YcaQ
MMAGPWWSTLPGVRTGELPARLVASGDLSAVQLRGSNTVYLAPSDWRERYGDADHTDDGNVRILAPLDPILWNRKLVQHVFEFEYVWEVYQPKAKRVWGYYVCPLLREGQLVGRFEGRVENGELQQLGLWKESERWDESAWSDAFDAHAERMKPSAAAPSEAVMPQRAR